MGLLLLRLLIAEKPGDFKVFILRQILRELVDSRGFWLYLNIECCFGRDLNKLGNFGKSEFLGRWFQTESFVLLLLIIQQLLEFF